MENLEIKKFWERFGIATFSFLLGFAFCAGLMISWSNKENTPKAENVQEVINAQTDSIESQEDTISAPKIMEYKVTATVYNPTVGQCDDSPLVTADCSKIDLGKLESGDLKWVALSRDLLEYFNYGDVIELVCFSDPSINGFYEVHDTMNKRFKNYIDILMPCSKTLGKWEDVMIRKIES